MAKPQELRLGASRPLWIEKPLSQGELPRAHPGSLPDDRAVRQIWRATLELVCNFGVVALSYGSILIRKCCVLALQSRSEETPGPAICPVCAEVMVLTRVAPILMSGGREEHKFECEQCRTVDYRISQFRHWQVAAE
jgi:hypothetical protein